MNNTSVEEDTLLEDGINSVLLAGPDGELHDGWELRFKGQAFVGLTVDELVDNLSKSGLFLNSVLLVSLLVQLEERGLEVLVGEDEETLLAC
jgi:hypothetical protein